MLALYTVTLAVYTVTSHDTMNTDNSFGIQYLYFKWPSLPPCKIFVGFSGLWHLYRWCKFLLPGSSTVTPGTNTHVLQKVAPGLQYQMWSLPEGYKTSAPGLLSQNWLLQYYSRESSSSFLPYSSLITKLPPNMTCILCHSKIMLLYHSRRPKDIFNLLMTCSFP